MRFLSAFFAVAGALAMLSSTLASPAPVSPNLSSVTTLTVRQTGGAVDIPLCATVDLNNLSVDASLSALVLGLPVLSQTAASITLAGLRALGLLNLNLGVLCLCTQSGVLTGDSLARISTAISTSADGSLLDFVGTVLGTTLEAVVEPLALGLLNNENPDPVCVYPDNSVATDPDAQECGSSCPYVCDTGFEACGDFCIPVGDPCISGVPGRKRSIRERSRFACRQPFTACPVSHFLARDTAASYGGGFECVDTTADLESCGGCVNPFKGNVAGKDCTAIANVDSVSCTFGKCVVESCAPGFVPSTGATSCVAEAMLARLTSSRLLVQGRKART